MALAFAAAPAAQAADHTKDYRRAVEFYRQGLYRESVDVLVRIGPASLQIAAHGEMDIALKSKDVRPLEAAAVLLLDSAAAEYVRGQMFPSVVFNRLAIDALERLKALHAHTGAMRDWYIAEGAFLEGVGDFNELRSQLAAARKLFPRDPLILLSSGSALETEGRDLADAAAFYRASLAVDDADPECRLRLARVLYRLNDAEGSLRELDRLSSVKDDRFVYLRDLFRAASLASLRKTADAEGKFVDALQWNAQAPFLGLAESMYARGDEAGARAVIAKLLAARVEEEPWGAYQRGQWRYLTKRIAEARAALK